jgi:hypothetical protein
MSRADRDLHHAVMRVAEELVRLLDPRQRIRVGDPLAKREAPGRDDAHQPAHALLSPRTERGDDGVIAEPGIERTEWQPQVPRVDAQARHDPARADRAEAALEGLRCAQRLDREVGAAAGEPLDLGDDVLLGRWWSSEAQVRKNRR